jgi:hypothetical protein
MSAPNEAGDGIVRTLAALPEDPRRHFVENASADAGLRHRGVVLRP